MSHGSGFRIEVVGKGMCAVCAQRVEQGPYAGKRVTIGRMATVSFVVDEHCARALADALNPKRPE